MGQNILVSAGEASGDYYASMLVADLGRLWPGARFFGCAGPRMRRGGVEAVIESESLSVVGLVEVLGHLPRIYGQYRKMAQAAAARKPGLAFRPYCLDLSLCQARLL